MNSFMYSFFFWLDILQFIGESKQGGEVDFFCQNTKVFTLPFDDRRPHFAGKHFGGRVSVKTLSNLGQYNKIFSFFSTKV